MPLEIEHKFLLKNDNWKALATHSRKYKQGYLISDNKRSIRVRISDDKAWLNIKSATIGPCRQEYEYEIPVSEALEIMNTLCQRPIIEKTRYFVPILQHTWEVDVFVETTRDLLSLKLSYQKTMNPSLFLSGSDLK